MRLIIAFVAAGTILCGCVGSTPSDAEQQKMAKDWSPENVAKEY